VERFHPDFTNPKGAGKLREYCEFRRGLGLGLVSRYGRGKPEIKPKFNSFNWKKNIIAKKTWQGLFPFKKGPKRPRRIGYVGLAPKLGCYSSKKIPTLGNFHGIKMECYWNGFSKVGFLLSFGSLFDPIIFWQKPSRFLKKGVLWWKKKPQNPVLRFGGYKREFSKFICCRKNFCMRLTPARQAEDWRKILGLGKTSPTLGILGKTV